MTKSAIEGDDNNIQTTSDTSRTNGSGRANPLLPDTIGEMPGFSVPRTTSWQDADVITSMSNPVIIRHGPSSLAQNLRIDTAVKEKDGAESPFAQDSLSLVQLKRLVAEVPRMKQAEYSYVYADVDSLQAELEEWFSYKKEEQDILLDCKARFETIYNEVPWIKSSKTRRLRFMTQSVDNMESSIQHVRLTSLMSLSYLVQGVFGESRSMDHQLHWIKENCKMLRSCSPVDGLWGIIRAGIARAWESEGQAEDSTEDTPETKLGRLELQTSLTIFYFILETGREDEQFRRDLGGVEPNIAHLLVETVAKMRWSDAGEIPLHNILQILWKILLAIFGTSEELTTTKALQTQITSVSAPLKKVTPSHSSTGSTFAEISATPLDYHNFRQELLSKYPAYNPPPMPTFFASTPSLLPANLPDPLPTQPLASTTPSILHQPVHIATPAPSPPPSPVGTKGAKKHNYQTNQNFPFLYPPTASGGWKDGWASSSSDVGVPLSIKEGGDLFRDRVRVTTALRQLEEEKERFLKIERGWTDESEDYRIKMNEITDRLKRVRLDNEREQQRLDNVDEFYASTLPYLQSFVIVLLKQILTNITVPSPTTANPNVSPQNNAGGRDDDFLGIGSLNDILGLAKPPELTQEEMEKARAREIMSKAIAALITVMLKWFRVSHVLKFEYLTQLLLDSNYMPLVLKGLNQQEVSTLISSIHNKEEYSYFFFCNQNSANPKPLAVPKGTASAQRTRSPSPPDFAAPPPIRMRREMNPPTPSSTRPQLEELNFNPDNNNNPPLIITEYSARNFHTVVNLLKIMAKLCKGKAHRNLLMVQYKSGAILKKGLKVPQEDLRLYTLKLFKGQVPYCGRKWRQSNMRVITSIYLYCRPELRDDWLAGSDVDAEVEEALPQEQALRSLTHFYNLHHYPASINNMGFNAEELVAEERDFFARALERLDRNGGDGNMGQDGMGESDGGSGGGGGGGGGGGIGDEEGWDGPPVMEGWNVQP